MVLVRRPLFPASTLPKGWSAGGPRAVGTDLAHKCTTTFRGRLRCRFPPRNDQKALTHARINARRGRGDTAMMITANLQHVETADSCWGYVDAQPLRPLNLKTAMSHYKQVNTQHHPMEIEFGICLRDNVGS